MITLPKGGLTEDLVSIVTFMAIRFPNCIPPKQLSCTLRMDSERKGLPKEPHDARSLMVQHIPRHPNLPNAMIWRLRAHWFRVRR